MHGTHYVRTGPDRDQEGQGLHWNVEAGEKLNAKSATILVIGLEGGNLLTVSVIKFSKNLAPDTRIQNLNWNVLVIYREREDAKTMAHFSRRCFKGP